MSDLPPQTGDKVPSTTQPEVLAQRAVQTADGETTVCEVEVRIPEELVYFAGHFVDDPVLPGVFQLNDIVLAQVEELWPELSGAEKLQLRRLKFINIIRPGDRILLRLERRPAPREVSFTITRGDTRCTAGILAFGGDNR